ncbi:hypothetical protein BC827DRAFT_1272422 [Russula dissimulans]|nr:hypothetical protein BC827DRAFT_1272422 [Russula dissimulans]
MGPLSSTRACRKYVDLIYRANRSFVNWDPLRKIEVGDFGRIDPETGQFVREGNIYQDEPLASITKEYPPLIYGTVHEHKIDSSTSTRRSRLPDFGVGDQTTMIRDIIYRCQWEFKDKRAAFLFMLRARKITIPPRFLTMVLKDEDGPMREMRSKNIVTSVWVCPKFGMYLSNKTREHVKIALYSPKAGSGQEEESWWHLEGNVGVHQFGNRPSEDYRPLYRLESVQKNNLGVDQDGTEVIWLAPDVPWGRLDEDGFEVDSGHGERAKGKVDTK